MTQLNMTNKNLTNHKQSSVDYIFESSTPYPDVNLEAVSLPIKIHYSGWIEVLFILALSVFILSFISGMGQQQVFSFHPVFIFNVIILLSLLTFLLINIHRLIRPLFLIIDKQGIQYRKGWFNLTNFKVISFDNIYGAYYTFEHNRYGGKRCYLNLPLVDGHEIAMKNLTKENHLKINVYKSEKEALYLTAVTQALIKDYHLRHNLVDKLPILKVIEQKPLTKLF